MAFRPRFASFVLWPWMKLVAWLVGLGALVAVALPFLALRHAGVWYFLVSLVLALGYLLHRWVAFGHERCELRDGRLSRSYGTLLSRGSVEMALVNVTLVTTVRPWLEDRFLGTGRVEVRAAGSAATEVVLPAQGDVEGLLETLTGALEEHGFRLSRDQLLIETQPGLAGRLVDILPKAASYAAVALVLAVQLVTLLVSALPQASGLSVGSFPGYFAELRSYDVVPIVQAPALADGVSGADLWRAYLAVLGLSVMGVVLALAGTVVRWMDLSRRWYRVYADRIDFADGFLTRRLAMIASENLSDVQMHAPFLLRLVNHANLTLSTQGSGNAITFELVPGARGFVAQVQRLIDTTPRPAERVPMASQGEGAAERSQGEDADTGPAEAVAPRTGAVPLKVERSPAHAPAGGFRRPEPEAGPDITLKMAPRVAILGPGLLAMVVATLGTALTVVPVALAGDAEGGAPPSWGLVMALVAGVGAFAGALAAAAGALSWVITTYHVGRRAIGSRVALFEERKVEFSIDKVTTMSVLRGPLDRVWGTATVSLTSVGAALPLVLRNIPLDAEQEDLLVRRLAMPRGALMATHRPRWSPAADWLLSPLWSLLLLGVLGLWPLLWVLGVSAPWFWLAPCGVLVLWAGQAIVQAWQTPYRRMELLNDGVRASSGVLWRTVVRGAWMDLRHVGSSRAPGCRVGVLRLHFGGPGHIRVPFLREPIGVHHEVDGVLSGVPADEDQVLAEDRPVLVPALLRLLPWVWITGPLVLPLVGLMIVGVRTSRYGVSVRGPWRYQAGVWERRWSVVWAKVDHATVHQGPLQRLFRVGSMAVFTSGSTGADLSCVDAPHAEALASALRRQGRG